MATSRNLHARFRTWAHDPMTEPPLQPGKRKFESEDLMARGKFRSGGRCVREPDPEDDFNPEIFPDGNIPSWHHPPDTTDASTTGLLDGLADKKHTAAVFVHAGAGYHSVQNERIHLEACSEACRMAMKLLKTGASAVQAVEAAIKVLEDNEITNCGYGSNLTIDGGVECDATIVDDMGRSGACGAVPGIKNPISLARVILDTSCQKLTLRRVPPNFLVGEGAKDFAWQMGMPIVSNDFLVAPNARDRYVRWKQDLKRADAQEAALGGLSTTGGYLDNSRHNAQRDHANAIMTGTWNEGQPDSPGLPTTPTEKDPTEKDPVVVHSSPTKARSPFPTTTHAPPSPTQNDRNATGFFRSMVSPSSPSMGAPRPRSSASRKKGRIQNQDGGPSIDSDGYDEDLVTDTVGAIAIDHDGFIAAGSSSGGIGIKHRGRVGPAAMVGVGTAVVPMAADDFDGVSVAAVTSGTGEHMATTMASQRCAERLYHGTKRSADGSSVAEEDESAILKAFVVNDFQEHPGVRNSASEGAIGAMAVKKTLRGYYLYFTHNTDSFALASMGEKDRSPHCVMSRRPDGAGIKVAQGGRKVSID